MSLSTTDLEQRGEQQEKGLKNSQGPGDFTGLGLSCSNEGEAKTDFMEVVGLGY